LAQVLPKAMLGNSRPMQPDKERTLQMPETTRFYDAANAFLYAPRVRYAEGYAINCRRRSNGALTRSCSARREQAFKGVSLCNGLLLLPRF